jgi:hypothetical protein
VGVCNQIPFLVLYYKISRLVPLLEVINAPIQFPDIVYLTVSFQFLNFKVKALRTSNLTARLALQPIHSSTRMGIYDFFSGIRASVS